MRFETGEVEGAYVVAPEPVVDDRGFFARVFDVAEFAARGLVTDFVQGNVSLNTRERTLRGMHWQAAPHEETKLVRCTAGAVYDVVVDLRPASRTYLRWMGAELTAENRLAMYAPTGVAHGYLTLTPGAEVTYQVSHPFTPAADRGARWDDPAFDIRWPDTPLVVSTKDANHPPYTP